MNVKELLEKYEVDRVEFKQELPAQSIKYLKTVVAFANSTGGLIVVGVADETHDVTGIGTADVPAVCDSIANAISDAITPQILPEISVEQIAGKSIVLAEIFPGANRPYYIKAKGKEDGTYIRVGGTTRPASPAILKELELEGTDMSYDSLAYLEGEYTEKTARKLCRVIEQHIFEKTDARKKVGSAQLENWGLVKRSAGKIVPTNAFMLMTDNPFMFATIQCARFKGTTRSVFIDKREYGGPLYEQIENAYQFVLKHINLGAWIEGLFRKESYELPPDSIRELIINAVTHRNYAENSSVQVSIFDDRVEITSPGMLYGGVTLKEILSGTSKIRNKVIATVFVEMYLIEKWGTGIGRVIGECRKYGVADPEFIELGTSFRVNMFRKQESDNDRDGDDGNRDSNPDSNDSNSDSNDSNPESGEEALLALIKSNTRATYNDLADSLGVSYATIARMIKELRASGRLIRKGSTRGEWDVK